MAIRRTTSLVLIVGSVVVLARCASDVVGNDAASDAHADLVSGPDARRDDGTSAEDATIDAAGGCTSASCDAGLVCVHNYYTHDPPGPCGDACTCPMPMYGRCWTPVMDSCEPVPGGCDAGATCSCPPLMQGSLSPNGCLCNTDGTFTCYSIGI